MLSTTARALPPSHHSTWHPVTVTPLLPFYTSSNDSHFTTIIPHIIQRQPFHYYHPTILHIIQWQLLHYHPATHCPTTANSLPPSHHATHHPTTAFPLPSSHHSRHPSSGRLYQLRVYSTAQVQPPQGINVQLDHWNSLLSRAPSTFWTDFRRFRTMQPPHLESS